MTLRRARRRPPRALLAAALLVAFAVVPAPASAAVPRLGHVFLIVGENTSYAQITPRHAPFLTGTIRPQGAWLTNYHSFTRSSSLGEYIAMVSGQFTRCEANNDLPDHCHQRAPNLFAQLAASGRSWRDWEESMTNACDPIDGGAAWARNIYSAPTTTPRSTSPACRAAGSTRRSARRPVPHQRPPHGHDGPRRHVRLRRGAAIGSRRQTSTSSSPTTARTATTRAAPAIASASSTTSSPARCPRSRPPPPSAPTARSSSPGTRAPIPRRPGPRPARSRSDRRCDRVPWTRTPRPLRTRADPGRGLRRAAAGPRADGDGDDRDLALSIARSRDADQRRAAVAPPQVVGGGEVATVGLGVAERHAVAPDAPAEAGRDDVGNAALGLLGEAEDARPRTEPSPWSRWTVATTTLPKRGSVK